jgi:hypothetical protein
MIARSVDVVVVGAGVAGLSAATAAAYSGQSVVVIEKSDVIGGTARFANGSIWIPNNDLVLQKGIRHDEGNEVRFILSHCYQTFDPKQRWCGVGKDTYARVGRYVRWSSSVVRDLVKEKVQSFTQLDAIFSRYFFSPRDSVAAAARALESKGLPTENLDLGQIARLSWDYQWQNPYNDVPYGKHIWAAINGRITSRFLLNGLRKHVGHVLRNLASIRSWTSLVDQLPKLIGKFWGFGHGLILVEGFRRHLQKVGVEVRTGHSLAHIYVEQGRVSAIEVATGNGGRETWEIRNALIVASGCYSQHVELRTHNHAHPIRSSCVVPTNVGDALRILEGYDVQMNLQPGPLLSQSVLQAAIDSRGISHEPVFFIYGDSFFVVDRHGQRVMNEKLNYHARASLHIRDPERELLFLIFDRRFKERYWGLGIGLPFDLRYIIKAGNPEDLRARIHAELQRYGVEFTLAEDFASNLHLTRKAFDGYARDGRDREFGRGDNAYDVLGYPKPDRDNTWPSRTMYPLTGAELYACIYCLSTFGTQGGLVCDSASRVLSTNGTPWKNLYAVGTCAASALNGHYPSHGMAIGTGLVFGYLAGLHATQNLSRLAACRARRASRGA